MKLNRSEKHIAEFRDASTTFFGGKPYEYAFSDDLKTNERFWYMTRCDDIPKYLSAIVGDALQNLRSCLDYVIHEAIFKETGRWPIRRTIGFPIGEDSSKTRHPEFGRRVEGLGQAAKELILSLKPYQGGNDTLWRLHSLNNLDKHQLLVVAASALTGHTIPPSVRKEVLASLLASNPTITYLPEFTNVTMSPHSSPFPLKNGCELLRLPIGELEEFMSFTFDIAFQQPPALGIRVFNLLESTYCSVLDIVERFEAADLV